MRILNKILLFQKKQSPNSPTILYIYRWKAILKLSTPCPLDRIFRHSRIKIIKDLKNYHSSSGRVLKFFKGDFKDGPFEKNHKFGNKPGFMIFLSENSSLKA